MLFLRAHEIVKWWGAEAHALHMMDVDMNHHPKAHPRTDRLHDGACLINAQYRHCYQHVGGIQTVGETRHVPADLSQDTADHLGSVLDHRRRFVRLLGLRPGKIGKGVPRLGS